MKKLFTLLLLLLSLSPVKADYWTQKADFGGGTRWGAIGFSIGNKGYIGTGSDSFPPTYKNDFWEYDPVTNIWTQKANFSGPARWGAIGFNIGNKGYITTGNGSINYMNDLWEYDPVGNTWNQKANIPAGRYDAATFVIGLKAFVIAGIGNSGYLQDVWEWDQLTNTWTQKANFGGGIRFEPTGFSLNNYGYAGLGFVMGVWKSDMWEYNLLANTWTQKNNFGGSGRAEAVSFSLNSKGYIGTGDAGSIHFQDFWEYNSLMDAWTQKQNVGGLTRSEARGFSIGNKGYIGTGDESVFNILNDFWEYTPDSTTSIEELPTSNLEFTISPNPAKEFIVISLTVPKLRDRSYPLSEKEKINLTITDVNGKKVYETKFSASSEGVHSDNYQLPISNFRKGIYFVEVSEGNNKSTPKFIKE